MKTPEQFDYPAVHTRISFGCGTVRNLPARVRELGSTKVLLVSDPGIARAGILDTVSGILRSDRLDVKIYDGIPQDSSTEHIHDAAEVLKKAGASCVIGLGGGSSIDAAKAVAIAAVSTGPVSQYAGLDKVPMDPLPVIAIPTTSGTGSEVSYWSVMTDDETGLKISIGGEKVFPRVALCDPDLTVGLPPYITATTGMDALTHAVESYTNKTHQPISSALTLRAVELTGMYLVRAVRDGGDRDARYGMMLASTLAGLGMNPTRLGLVHALAMPLGSWDIKIAHGAANAVLLSHSMKFNLEAEPEKFADVAIALGAGPRSGNTSDLARDSEALVRTMAEKIGIPKGLGELGLKEDQIQKVCREAMKSGNIPVNPREVQQKDLEDICRRAL